MNKDNPQEIATLKMQIRKQIGIAACERFVVLSGESIYLGEGHHWDNGTAVDVWSWLNPARPVKMGDLQAGDETDSFKNTEIFINAWKILISSKALEGGDWVVKVDPDAVFFPERLRKHVKKYSWGTQTKTPMYFKNCNFQKKESEALWSPGSVQCSGHEGTDQQDGRVYPAAMATLG